MRVIIILSMLWLSTAFAQRGSQENVNDFNVVDANHDEVISRAEFDAFYQRQVGSNVAKAHSLFANYDIDTNGKLTVAEFVPLAFSFSRQPLKQENEFFDRLDGNNDGILTRAEIQRSEENLNKEIIDGLFAVADSDRDGRITHREYKVAIGSSSQKNAKYSGLAQSLIASIDSNHDQRISKTEVVDFVAHFNRNKVSSSDINNLFHELDANRDGFLDETELHEAPEKISKIVGVRPMPNVFGN